MADASDDDVPGLEGWGTPPARAGFAERVLARADELAQLQRATRRRAWALPFALGAAVGGLVVATALALREPASAPAAALGIHVQVPGIGDVVGEPGADVQWQRGVDGRFIVVLDEGIAWVRVVEGAALELVAGGDPVALGGACGRVEVQRHLLGVDVGVDTVDCARIEEAIARAELSRDEPR